MKMTISRVNSTFWISAFLSLALHANTLEGMPGTLFSPSAQTMGHLGLTVSAGALGQQDMSMVRDNRFYFHETGNAGDPDTAQIQDFQSGMVRLNAALGLGRFVDIGISIPYFVDFIGDTKASDLSGGGFGDPSLALKSGFSLVGDHILSTALLGHVTLPSKSPEGFLPKQAGYIPKDSLANAPYFFSSYAVGGSVQSLWTLDLTRLEDHPPFRANLNVGAQYTGAKGSDSRFELGGGLEWTPLPSLEFFGNLQTETPFSKLKKPGDIGKEFSYAAAGFKANSDDGIFFSVALQKSLPNRAFHPYSKQLSDGRMSYETRYQPSIAVAITLGWSGALVSVDTDKDGVLDDQDLCIVEPEDMDGFQDQDGCTEVDNDQDSLYDAVDKCPLEPEDRDGFQDDDGCPEPDNDKDGISDLQDKCPNEPEDQDGFEDYDGCPELDNDQDGVPDLQDKCTTLGEDKDGFEDSDGCPDPDNDHDKIPDINDKCPTEPENYNGFEDGDGCPDQLSGSTGGTLAPLKNRIHLRMVKFVGNTANLLPESFPCMDTLALQIRNTPGAMLEIRGYVDDSGSELAGMRLSEERAMAVRQYLLSKAVSENQVLARGMGARDPIANNHTAAGRAQNRRIEVHRLQ